MIGLPDGSKSDATQWTAVAFIFLYNFFFGYGWNGVPWLYAPEVRMRTFDFNLSTLYFIFQLLTGLYRLHL